MMLLAFNIALAATLAAGAGLLAERLCHRRTIPLRHGLLWMTLIVVAATPLLAWAAHCAGIGMVRLSLPPSSVTPEVAPLPPVIAPIQPTAHAAPALAIPSPAANVPLHHSINAFHRAATVAPMAIGGLLILWLAGTVVQLSRLLRASALLWRLSAATHDLGPDVTGLVQRSARRLGLRRPPLVRGSAPLPSPLVFSIFQPRVLLPLQAASLPVDELEAVLLHEMAHVARGDQWAGLVEALVRAAFWWCPLVTILVGRLGDLREQLCDAHVVACQGHGLNLAAALLEVCQWSLPGRPHWAGAAALGAAGRSGSALRHRIQSLTQQETHPMTPITRRTRLAIAATGLLIAGAVAGINVRAADYSSLHPGRIDYALTPTHRMLAEDNFWEQVGCKSKHNFDKDAIAELKARAEVSDDPKICVRASKLVCDLNGTFRISSKLPAAELERAISGTFEYLEAHLADAEIAKFAPQRGFEHVTVGNQEGDILWFLMETVNLPPKFNGGLNIQYDLKAGKVVAVKQWGDVRPPVKK